MKKVNNHLGRQTRRTLSEVTPDSKDVTEKFCERGVWSPGNRKLNESQIIAKLNEFGLKIKDSTDRKDWLTFYVAFRTAACISVFRYGGIPSRLYYRFHDVHIDAIRERLGEGEYYHFGNPLELKFSKEEKEVLDRAVDILV